MYTKLLTSSGFAAIAAFSLMLQHGVGSQASSQKTMHDAAPQAITINPRMHQTATRLNVDWRNFLVAMPLAPASPAVVSAAEITDRKLVEQILTTITGEIFKASSTTKSELTRAPFHDLDQRTEDAAQSTTEGAPVAAVAVEADSAANSLAEPAMEQPDTLAAKTVKLLTTFKAPDITGFLSPDGFVRAGWQSVSKAPVLADSGRDKDRFVIMLDPGHGGIDPGAEAHNGLTEKELTLDIARRARLFLSEFDEFDVVLTRDHDHGLSRQARVNAIGRSKADLVVSIHFNHLPQTDLTLVESYYAARENIAESLARRNKPQRRVATGSSRDLSFTKRSERLAHTLQQRVFGEVSFNNPGAEDAGVKKETLFVLTRSFTPGVLIELTPLSNVAEAEKLTTDEYRNRLAAALVDGIRAYHGSLEHSPLDTSTDIGA